MRQIPVKRSAAPALVDDADYDRLNKLTWFLSNRGYAVASTHVDGKIINFLMHRMVLNPSLGFITDHADTNRLNNTRSNLRLCSYSQNNMNLRKRRSCRSAFKGVSWSKQKGKWHARIKLEGKAKHLGFFSDETAAALAYDRAAVHLFGDFARINHVGEYACL